MISFADWPRAWACRRSAGSAGSWIDGRGVEGLLEYESTKGAAGPVKATGSDIGSLFPFVQSQAVHGEFPLSFLRPEFTELDSWKRRSRGRVMDLLHYTPPPVDPRPEILGRRDAGDYVEEHVEFSTTPDLRVPATVLIPKGLKGKAPAIVALHDHGGFYLWGREKIVETEGEHPALTEFKRGASRAGASPPSSPGGATSSSRSTCSTGASGG